MKKLSIIITAVMLALVIAATLPAQVFAASVPEYISEVKIGMGKKASDAKAALEGYKILSDAKGNPVDLNKSAGGGWGSKGDKVVYLGYKTTTDRKDAISDLALMNMKGGYSVQDYEVLMETQMKSQIIPFVDNFKSALEEYRENYNSDNPLNKARAQYAHDALNMLTDDDSYGKGLGDLLLNKTRYELGDEFNDIPPQERSNYADILTILAQSNGKATLIMENLITRAADTGEDSWLDRLSDVTYDKLVDAVAESEGLLPTDAKAETAKLYDDGAKKLLNLWDAFSEELASYDEAYKTANKFDSDAYEEAVDNLEGLTDDSAPEEMVEAVEEFAKQQANSAEFIQSAEIVAIHDYLKDIEYGDGTLLDFFSTPASEIEEDITVLYPVVASLSEGQLAGLEFVSLRELFAIALTDEDGYADKSFEDNEKVSIYDGVDRGIYAKGGVALTSDALRADAMSRESEDGGAISPLTITMYVLSGLAAAGLIASAVIGLAAKFKSNMLMALNNVYQRGGQIDLASFPTVVQNLNANASNVNEAIEAGNKALLSRSSFCGKLALGFGVAMVILAGISTYLTYKDLVAHYKVEFTPIPNYMVDEKDITAFDENGEKIVLKNQAAYYKAVQCNRTYKDEMYDVLGETADLNGDVGKQWLALYAQKSDVEAPILASSLVVRVGDTNIPAGYKTGIHMFGASTAFNLNNELYDWNKDAPSIMVYFKVDEAAAETGTNAAGSTFTAGNLALAGVAGLAVGAVVTALASKAVGRKKKSAA